VDGIVDGEESDERGISATWRYISSYVGVDEGFIQCEYIIERPSLQYLASDRHTGGGDDRHISVEGELAKDAVIDDEEYLYDISTDAVRLSIANIRMIEYPLIRRIG
jgi:hypothetical protein